MNAASRKATLIHCLVAGLALLFCSALRAQTSQQAFSATLAHPMAIAIDLGTGDIYFAERDAHRVRKLTSSGTVELVAGTGVQGFSGDGGPALLAEFNSPEGLALTADGDLIVADTGNNRLRMVSRVTGFITTIAGTGARGFNGDGGLASQAMLCRPRNLAISKDGDVAIADGCNHRIRGIHLQNGQITTLAGTGAQGDRASLTGTLSTLDSPEAVAFDATGRLFIADAASGQIAVVDANTKTLNRWEVDGATGRLRPTAITFDGVGNLLIADADGQRILRISADHRATQVLAGAGAQAFQGDGSNSAAALLDGPAGLGVSPNGSVVFADSGNNRLRSVAVASQQDATIATIAGSTSRAPSYVLLSGPPEITYGSGSLEVSVTSTGALSGSIVVQDNAQNFSQTFSSSTLANGRAMVPLATLSKGVHRITANYSGDGSHAAGASSTTIAVDALPIAAAPQAAAMLFGQPAPAITGSLAGALAQDVGKVGLALRSDANSQSPPGTYPIEAALTGPAAANYSLQIVPAVITVSKAPATVILTSAAASILVARVQSTTSGTPSGLVTLCDQNGPIASGSVGSDGSWTVSTDQWPAGSHDIHAVYAGDPNFTAAQSSPVSVVVAGNPISTSTDFSLTLAGGPSQITLTPGGTATAAFVMTPVQGELAGPVSLAISGLPTSLSASFDPPVLPPGGGVRNLTVHISPNTTTGNSGTWQCLAPVLCVALLPFGWLRNTHDMRRFACGLLITGVLFVAAGCGDRTGVAGSSGSKAPSVTYNLRVTGSTTTVGGQILQHSVDLLLVVQS